MEETVKTRFGTTKVTGQWAWMVRNGRLDEVIKQIEPILERRLQESTAARKDVQRVLSEKTSGERNEPTLAQDYHTIAGTQALPVDTILKPGRPSTGFDKKAYNRQYMRKRRAEIKAGIRIPKKKINND